MAMSTAPRSVSTSEFTITSILVPLIGIIIGIFMVILDATAVNVAVPSLVRDFRTNLGAIQWTITGYALAQAGVIPLAGWLSDRFGAKRIFLISVALFTAGSVLCATAQSAEWLIVFRVLQGIGGGCVLPISMAYVYRLAPPERVGAVMGLMGIPILLAPAIGPVVAGWLVQYHSWRWIFLLNLPVGIIGVLIGLRGLPRIDRQAVAHFDLPGAILGPLAFVALSYGINQGATSWAATKTIGGLVIGALALLAFAVVELRRRAPLLELRVFGSVDFSLAIVVQWVGFFAMFGALFLVPLFLQQDRGYGAFDTGLALLPQAIAAAVFMPIGGALFDRVGARPLVVVGLGMVAAAMLLLATIGVTTTGVDLILPLSLSGAGMGLMLMPLNTHLINAAPRALVSRVTSLTNALQQVINSLTVATLATILSSRATAQVTAARAAFFAAHPGRLTPAAQHLLQGRLAVAFARAFDDTFRIMIGVAVVAAVLGFLLRRNRAAQRAERSDLPEEAAPIHAAVG